MADKINVVREVFENTAQYLKYDYNLQIRKETVLSFTANQHFQSILDMPCGTGAMSIPLLNQTDQLTMIDISENMLAIATAGIPPEQKHKAKTIHHDFFSLDLPPHHYDLIICLGLLAHVNSPEQLLTRISLLLKPGGTLIIQNTDADHFYNYLIRFYLGLKNLIKKQSYSLNKVPGKFVESTLASHGLTLEKKYSMTRHFFGDALHNKHANWGSDVTYLFRKK